MYKHILLPTDGSEISNAAIQKAIQFAKSINAKVTGLHVVVPFHGVILIPEMYIGAEEKYYSDSNVLAETYLAVIQTAAQEAGVTYDTTYVNANHAYEGIIRFAEENGCDLILMATHGRSGVQALVLGSETTKVLTHTKLPVFVFH